MAKCLCGRDAGWGRNRCNNCYAKDDYYGSIGKESFIFGKKVKFTRGFCNGRIGILINHDGESFKWGAGGTSKKYKIELEDGYIVEESLFNLELVD